MRRPVWTSRTARGAAELTLVGLVAMLFAGALLGNGLTRTAVGIVDGLTWLGDDPTGEVIQVNPATGRPEVRMRVGAPGDDLDVAQYDGLLYVLNRSTGLVTSLDMTDLAVAGRAEVGPGDAGAVLEHGGAVYLVDRDAGTITAMDQDTTDPIGEIYVATDGLADAAIDGAGVVWALDPEGVLTRLRWSITDLAFVVEDTRRIEHSGDGSLLVAHERGVTVFGPDEGIVVQEGTGSDVVADARALTGDLEVPRRTPDGLAVASAPDSGTVVIVGDGEVREVDVAAIGCAEPGRPEVFEDVIYVPCPGDGRVLRLTPAGERASADIVTPDGADAEPVLDDGTLFINVPGAEKGVLVRPDGSLETITRYDADLPRTPLVEKDDPPSPEPTPDPTKSPSRGPVPSANPTGVPTGLPPGLPTSTAAPTPNVPTGGPTTQPTGGPTRRPSPTRPPSPSFPTGTATPTTVPTAGPTPGPAALQAPTAVTATSTGAGGQVQVNWQHAGPAATSFAISRTNGGTLGTVAGDNRQGVVTVPVGTRDSFVVTAVAGGEQRSSSPSAPVDTSTRPGAPTGLGGSVQRAAWNAGSVGATITWTAAPDNGAAVSGYTVVVTGGNPQATQTVTVGGGQTSATVTVRCADVGTTGCDSGRVQATVHATNAVGDGPTTSGTVDTAPATPWRLPAGGNPVATNANTGYLGHEGFGQTDLTLSPPGDWAGFRGTCGYTHYGNQQGGPDTGSVPCGAGSLTVQIQHGVQHTGPTSEQVTIGHSIVFTADNGASTVQSATFSWQESQPGLCNMCPIP